MSKVQEFTLRAEKMYQQAQSRGEEVYGIKPWYSSVSLIENGTDIAFIGANCFHRCYQAVAESIRLTMSSLAICNFLTTRANNTKLGWMTGIGVIKIYRGERSKSSECSLGAETGVGMP